MVLLDRIARRYGVLPGDLVGERDEAKAFSINLHAAKWGSFQDQVDMRNATRGRGRG
jgi:hypothetical protein